MWLAQVAFEEVYQHLGQGLLGGLGVASKSVVGVMHGHQLDRRLDGLQALLQPASLATNGAGPRPSLAA